MDSALIIILTGIIIYLSILTYYLNKYKMLLTKLVNFSSKENLADILNSILVKLDGDKENINHIKDEIQRQSVRNLGFIQRVGILRYNPFSDTGGDQSFVMALLNGEDTGIVLTSLHNRGQSRWYAKNVRQGKGVGHELSKEEEKAIKMAYEANKKTVKENLNEF